MKGFLNWLKSVFRRKSAWDEMGYANKPSTAGDDFRKQNEV